jgi:restriction endonuclease Mrr
MAAPGAYIVAQWISSSIRDEGFLPLRVVLELVLVERWQGKSAEEIAEHAELVEHDVYHKLDLIAEQLTREGTEPPFTLEGDPGTAYIRAINVDSLVILERLRDLEPIQFEQFCADALTALGATARRTGGTGDGGVDFTASNLPVSNCAFAPTSVCRPIVIGQAKRYTGQITVTDLRSFLGGAILKADEMRRIDEDLGLFSPVIYAFWTTSGFTADARVFARRMGIWALSGVSLAQLALRLGVSVGHD